MGSSVESSSLGDFVTLELIYVRVFAHLSGTGDSKFNHLSSLSYSLFIIHYSLFIIHYSLFTIHDSSFTINDSPFIITIHRGGIIIHPTVGARSAAPELGVVLRGGVTGKPRSKSELYRNATSREPAKVLKSFYFRPYMVFRPDCR